MRHPTVGSRRRGRPRRRGGGAYPVESEIHLLDRVAVIYRYRAIAISVFILTTLAVIIQSSTAVPMFRAHARILIEDERSTAIPGLNAESQFFEDPEPYYNTPVQDPSRPGPREASRHETAAAHDSRVQRHGALGPHLAYDRARLRRARARAVSEPASPAAQEAPAAGETPDESALDRRTSSRASSSSPLVARVWSTCRSNPPIRSLRRVAANALAQEYVSQNLQLKLQTTDNMLQWLAQELATQQKKVQATEAALADYRDKQNAMSLDDKQNIVLSRLNKLNDDVVGAKTRKAQKEVLYNQIRGLTPAELGKASAIAQNLQVAAAQARVQEAQAERVRLAQRYGERHPDLLKAAANVQEAERVYLLEVSRAAQSIKNEYDTTVLEEQTYAQNLNAAKADAQDLSKKSVNYNLMEREANSNRQVYQSLLQRENELRVAGNSRANNVRIVDNAEVPRARMARASGRGPSASRSAWFWRSPCRSCSTTSTTRSRRRRTWPGS